MRNRIPLTLSTALAAFAASAQPQPSGQVALRITVYNEANVPANVETAVFESLSRIFERAGISIEWVNSTEPTPIATCRRQSKITLRFAAAAPPKWQSTILGVSHPWAPDGPTVTLFDNRIRAAATIQDRPYRLVMAHAIAHELGHVLLRTTSHTNYGLMTGTWTRNEYLQMGFGTLIFTRGQSRIMQAVAKEDGCTILLAARETTTAAPPGIR